MSDDVRTWTRIPEGENREKISVSIDADLLEKMDRLGMKTNRSRSNIVNTALRRTLPLE